jgi:hypothetical protein
MEKIKESDKQLYAVKQAIIKKIKTTYGMTVAEFASSRHAKFLNVSARSLASYLTPKGAVSYPVLKELCAHLGLGELKQTIRVERYYDYTLDNGKENTNSSDGKNRRRNGSEGNS